MSAKSDKGKSNRWKREKREGWRSEANETLVAALDLRVYFVGGVKVCVEFGCCY